MRAPHERLDAIHVVKRDTLPAIASPPRRPDDRYGAAVGTIIEGDVEGTTSPPRHTTVNHQSPSSRGLSGRPAVAAAATYDPQQGNW